MQNRERWKGRDRLLEGGQKGYKMRKKRVSAVHSQYSGYSKMRYGSGRFHIAGVVLDGLPRSSVQDVVGCRAGNRRMWRNQASRRLIYGSTVLRT